MSRLPIPRFIQEIKAKLGFDRIMTASGDDVVDAVNNLASAGKNYDILYQDYIPSSTTAINYTNNNNKYKYIFIRLRGDGNNGITSLIPNCLLTDGISLPLTLASSSNGFPGTTGYSVVAQGEVRANVINFSYISLSGWGSMYLSVYGIY